MKTPLFLGLVLASSFVIFNLSADTSRVVSVWKGCDGTVVSRTDVGVLTMTKTGKNLPGCVGPRASDSTSSNETLTGASTTTGGYLTGITRKPYDASQGPLLDLAQKDIVNYRIEMLKQQQIQYANALYSLRMRAKPTKQSETVAYLIKNDAVILTGSQTPGWAGVQGADVVVTDTRENTVIADTEGRAQGYSGRRYLRNPNSSDLVRIGQADNAYWSDVARVKVAHLVNVRQNPWYGAKVLHTLSNDTPLYVVSTVNNWSEVMSDDGAIRGYIRSDFLTIDKVQRVEVSPFL